MIPICILAIEDSDDREFMSQLFVQYQRLMYSTIFEILHDTWATEDVRRGIRQEKQHRTGKEYLTPAACQHGAVFALRQPPQQADQYSGRTMKVIEKYGCPKMQGKIPGENGKDADQIRGNKKQQVYGNTVGDLCPIGLRYLAQWVCGKDHADGHDHQAQQDADGVLPGGEKVGIAGTDEKIDER